MDSKAEETVQLTEEVKPAKRVNGCMVIWGITAVLLFVVAFIGFYYFGMSKRFEGTARNILQFNSKGEFTIVQITDSHYDDDVRDTLMTHIALDNVFAHEDPDFVAFTGDMVTGYNWDGSQGWFEKQWRKWSMKMSQRRTPYGYALGNHDVEADLNREQIVRLDQTNPYSMTQLGPEGPHNSTNYVLPVYSSTNASKVAMNLWFFDSGSRGCAGLDYGFGCIEEDVVNWYKERDDELQKEQGGRVPAMAFFHIPPQEFMVGWEWYNTTGHKYQETSCSILNTHIVDAFLEKGNVIALFVGHDHPNDFTVDYKGIMLAYGRKSGYGGYGIPHHLRKGGRVIKIKENPFSFDTYLSYENGVREWLIDMGWRNGTQMDCNY